MTTTDRHVASTDAADPAPAAVVNALPRRFLRPLLCLALSSADRSYGYELAEAVRGYGLSIDLGGVYRELRAMEQHDLLTSEWEPSNNGPDRRIYMTTAAGDRECDQAIELLFRARDHLSAALADVENR